MHIAVNKADGQYTTSIILPSISGAKLSTWIVHKESKEHTHNEFQEKTASLTE